MGQIAQHNLTIIRGNTKRLPIALASGFDADERAGWLARLVIREAQDDDLPSIFEQTLPIDFEDIDPAWPDSIGGVEFVMDPDETQALPPYRLVYFVEIHSADSTDSQRLFEGRVEVVD
jgi:hypothetical protein